MSAEQEGSNGDAKLDEPEFKFSTALSLEDIRSKHAEFCRERDWGQYHTPRNLLLAMVGEVGELSEVFQWQGEVGVGLPGWKEDQRRHLGEEMADVLIYLVRLAERCRLDLPKAVLDKMELNARKYPADQVRGKSRKYTELEKSSPSDEGEKSQ